ncbi:MAG: hypothetical protein PHO30_04820 [Candidatus Omnitrophica bacterium]|nr:hypothetical protein [Candidatus Omnitrophota bacterium]
MKSVIFFLLAFMACWTGVSRGDLNWKLLHEQAAAVSLAEAEQAVREDPQNIEKLYILGLMYFDRHQDKPADEVFARILAVNPNSFEGQWGRAEYLRRIHEVDRAEQVLTSIVSEYPDFFPAYISLGHIKFFRMDFETTTRLMNEVLRHDTTAVDTTTLVRAHCIYAGAKGMIAYYGGPLSKIINGINVMNHLKIAEKLQPDNVLVPYGFGCYYLLVPKVYGKNIDMAERYFNRAMAIDPLVPDIYVRLAEIWMIRDNQGQADEYLKKAEALDPGNELISDVRSKECKFVCGWDK